MRTEWLISLCLVAGLTAIAQDTRVLGDSIDHFKGMADEVRKNNPVLAAGTGEGIKALARLSGSRRSGTGPAQVVLPKAQQEELDRRQRAKERAARTAASRPAARVNPAPTNVPAITPLVMLAILHSPRKEPEIPLVAESKLAGIAPGQSRETIIAVLGAPVSVSRVQGLDDGTRERLTYHLSATRTAAVHLEAGRVVAVTRY